MSALTPESAREWADWLDVSGMHAMHAVRALRAEADRLEDAAKTPGQVLVEAMGAKWSTWPAGDQGVYERHAAAVIAHVVGPDNVIVSRAVVQRIVDNDDIHWQAEEHFAEALK